MSANDYAREIADRVIEALQQGTAPWQRPWQPGTLRQPFNPTTDKPYRGINSIWLGMQGYGDPRWMTFKQAAAQDAQVRKGSRGTRIEYWKFHEDREKRDEAGRPVLDAAGQPQRVRVELDRPRRFTAVVFNAEQIDGLAPLQARPMRPEPERHARAEAVLDNSGAKIRHEEGDRAFYRLADDSITLPERRQFEEADAYYATALHELGHWTGHPARLARDLAHPFGSEGYAREELRAEIGSLMIGEQLEIGHDPRQHIAYVKSWIKALQDDPREIFRAAADAEKIRGFVMGFEHSQTQDVEQERLPVAASAQTLGRQQKAGGSTVTRETTYLAVPYREKDEARRLGAKWDREAKSWYAPAGTVVEADGLGRWLPDGAAPGGAQPGDPPEQVFGAALREHGLMVGGSPLMDGSLHRVPVEGDRGVQKSGAYVGHLDGPIPAGFIQNFKTGEATNWRMPQAGVSPLSDQERAAAQAAAAANRQRRDAARAEGQARASAAALALWQSADPAFEENPYCQQKRISDPGRKGLRTVPDHAGREAEALGVRIAQTGAEAKAMRAAEPGAWVFQRGDLLVPLYGEGAALEGVQAVNPQFKGFMRSARKAGLYSVAGGTPEALDAALERDRSMPLLICEGYATGDTLAEALGHPVIVGLDSGNLNAVAGMMRAAHPERALVIAADNDPKISDGTPRNVGLEKGTAAAVAHGGALAAPQFEPGSKGTDWNDHAAEYGVEASGKAIREAVERATAEAGMSAARLRFYGHERMADARDNPATDADDLTVGRERNAAHASINVATEQESAVRADAANETGPDLASISLRNQVLKDEVKSERNAVLDGGSAAEEESELQQKRRFRRSRGR